MISVLHSPYIIDGVQQDLTPAQILGIACGAGECAVKPEPVVDESREPGLDAIRFDSLEYEDYLPGIISAERRMPLAFSGQFARSRVAGALIDAIWHGGHFRIGDLAPALSWKIDRSTMGNMAAFYRSVEAAGDYVSSLGLEFSDCTVAESDRCSLTAETVIAPADEAGELFVEQPFRAENPHMEKETIPDRLDDDPESWIVYIPFDTAEYRLGGSMLAQVTGQNGGVDPLIQDADYFIDCYEVVRELVEDGVAISGRTVLDGGLLAAVKRMTDGGTGASVDISDIMTATGEKNIIRILFAEIPGVIIQVRDSDFDYLDAELLLQDVAYYPLGHPLRNGGELSVRSSEKTGIQNILESLIRNQCGEGED